MTVEELYSKTKQMYFEKPSSTTYDPYLLENVNRVIRECFDENNMERMFIGIAPLTKPPYVNDRTDDIPYEDIFLNEIMPLGLAAYFLIDDDLSKYQIYITDYKNARIRNQKIVSQEVIDAFTGNA